MSEETKPDNVIPISIPMQTTLALPSLQILQGAIKTGVKDVIVLGYTEQGNFYFAAAPSDKRHILWLVENFKDYLMHEAE